MKPLLLRFTSNCRWAIAALAVCLTVAGPGGSARAQVLLDTIENHGGWAHINVYAPMAAWSQTTTYSGLKIAAMLNGGDGTTTGTFYLMDQVGPGTTTAHELARASFTITGSGFQPELVTLFDGLTLGPGTYYLVAGGSGLGGWEITTGPQAVFTAPDVSLTVNHYSAQIGNSYPPANLFYNAGYNKPDYNLEFVVLVPEPSAAALLLLSALVFLIFAPAPARAWVGIAAGYPREKAAAGVRVSRSQHGRSAIVGKLPLEQDLLAEYSVHCSAPSKL